MMKSPASFRSLGLMTVLCSAVLAACGGGSDEISFDILNPAATSTPVATATSTPVPTNTNTPVATATNTPVPTNTDTPVPTATNTNTPVPTATPTPPADSCAPGVPVNGQQVKMSMVAEDMQGPDNGQAIYPNLNSDITYTFNAVDGTFTAVASNASYVINPNGTYSPSTGDILTAQTPTLANPMNDSFVSFTPADWAQRLAKDLDGQPVNSTATKTVTLEARGYLPNLLANLNGGSADPQNEVIQNTFTATATRLANGTVNGVANACNFSFTLYRNFQYDPAVILMAGDHGSAGAPLEPNAVDEDAATANLTVSGDVLGQFAGDRSSMLFLEPYMPAFKGSFSTSSQVPFVPIKLKWTHVYGISSLSFPTYLNTDGATNARAVTSASAAAFQEFTYQP